TMPTGSIITLRNGIGSLLLLAYVWACGDGRQLAGAFGRWALLRTLVDAALTVLFFVALAHMPIANLTTIVQSLPIVVAAMAIFTLRETPGLARILTILAGFAGVLLIVQPGGEAFSIYAMLGVGVVFLAAARDILTRHIGLHVPGSVIAFGNIIGVAFVGYGLSFAEGGLRWPTPAGWGIGVMSGIFVAAGLVVLIKSLRMAPISVTAPFRYSVVLWSILSGYFIFGDVPNAMAMVGIALIIVSGIAAMRIRN
ncbi:MAG: DMT family transporter, partial [Aestuariivirgaceae bacterium]|nr:DMT family transporter [Aestuariivirgaceae bacterium]